MNKYSIFLYDLPSHTPYETIGKVLGYLGLRGEMYDWLCTNTYTSSNGNMRHPITIWPISAIEWTLLVTVCAGDIFFSEGETRFKPPPFLRALALKTSKCFLRSEKRKHLQLTHSYQSQQNTFYIEVLLQHWDNKLASWEAHKQTHWQATRLTDEKRTRGQEDKMIWYDICQYFLLSEQR